MPLFRRALGVSVAMLMLLSLAAYADALDEQPTETEVTAAFLFNFAKFTEWPPAALQAGQDISLCVARDNGVASALERITDGRLINGHRLAIVVVDVRRPFTCHLLYAKGLDDKDSTELFQLLNGAPVLTVGDRDGFIRLGGIAELILEGERMRIALNVAAARRAHVTLSSKLLSLATILKENTHDSH